MLEETAILPLTLSVLGLICVFYAAGVPGTIDTVSNDRQAKEYLVQVGFRFLQVPVIRQNPARHQRTIVPLLTLRSLACTD